jgi:hypothetical protein
MTKNGPTGCFSAPARSVAEEETEVASWVSTHVHLNHQSTTISPIGRIGFNIVMLSYEYALLSLPERGNHAPGVSCSDLYLRILFHI